MQSSNKCISNLAYEIKSPKKILSFTDCPEGCEINQICQDGKCVCSEFWGGANCTELTGLLKLRY